jgi:hypothetical protein
MRRLSALCIETRLAHLARDQFGIITRDQAARQGIDGDSLETRVNRKVLLRLHPGVYCLASVSPSAEQRILAGWLAVSEDSVSIAKYSAARIHGLPTGNEHQASVELIGFRDQQRRLSGINLRRTRTKPETHTWHGARINTASQTICDLAAESSGDVLARCIDHAISRRIATVASIRQLVLARPSAGFTGRSILMEVLDDRPDGRLKHRSMLEQRTGKWLSAAGLGDFVPNWTISEAGDLEIDFAWMNSHVGLEVSPFFTHGSEITQQRDIERRRLLAPTKWNVIEVTDEGLESPSAFAPTIVLLKRLIAQSR